MTEQLWWRKILVSWRWLKQNCDIMKAHFILNIGCKCLKMFQNRQKSYSLVFGKNNFHLQNPILKKKIKFLAKIILKLAKKILNLLKLFPPAESNHCCSNWSHPLCCQSGWWQTPGEGGGGGRICEYWWGRQFCNVPSRQGNDRWEYSCKHHHHRCHRHHHSHHRHRHHHH